LIAQKSTKKRPGVCMHLRFQVLSTQVFERHPDALILRTPNDQGTPLDPKPRGRQVDTDVGRGIPDAPYR